MKKVLASLLSLGLFTSCLVSKNQLISENFKLAGERMKEIIELSPDSLKFPRTQDHKGALVSTDMYDWTSGFFGGNLWYIYEYNQQPYWKQQAEKWTDSLEPLKDFTRHHDLGFMMYCSYGNGVRLNPNDKYKDILVQTAKSLITRFNPKTGVIKSWNYRKSLDGKTEWFYPVIIDNMMNLELLYYATKVTGDTMYASIATKHALTTMKNHFRPDFSSYHVVNYDVNTGNVLDRGAAQGYTDASTWARGQAWAIYGFTMAYRETGNKEFLHTAEKAADFYMAHKNMPEDLVPFWDLDVTDPSFKPVWENISGQDLLKRDVSAAAIVASGLLELCNYTGEKGAKYKEYGIDVLKSISKNYTNDGKDHRYFLLKNSVGSFPNNAEIDVPLVYADYYYLEALLRYKNLK